LVLDRKPFFSKSDMPKFQAPTVFPRISHPTPAGFEFLAEKPSNTTVCRCTSPLTCTISPAKQRFRSRLLRRESVRRVAIGLSGFALLALNALLPCNGADAVNVSGHHGQRHIAPEAVDAVIGV